MAKKTQFTEETLRQMGLVLSADGKSYSKAKTVPQPRDLIKDKQAEFIKKKGYDLVNIKPVSDKIIIAWADKDISLNSWYSSKHWSNRNKQKSDWHSFFKQFIHEPYPYFERYNITLEFNSRLDPSNCITMIKLLEDTLQTLGVLKNDTSEFCRGLHIIPVDSMKRKSYKITINSV